MTKDRLVRYAELKIIISNAEKELEMIKDQATAAFLSLRGDDDAIELREFPGYKFSTMKRKTWTYSGVVQDLDKRLKDRKKLEEQNGDATFTESETLVFKAPKE